MTMLAMFQAPAQGVNWLSVFAQNLSDLTTQNGGVLTSVGMSLLSFVAIMMLVQMVISINTANWTISFRPQSVDAGTVMRFMLRLGFCALLEHYWVNPFPGASFGFNHLFSYLAESLVQVLDQSSLDKLDTLLKNAATAMDTPSLTAPLELLCYVLVEILLGVSSGILFLINISSFILYGVSALFGPVIIPLYLTNSFRGKFFQYQAGPNDGRRFSLDDHDAPGRVGLDVRLGGGCCLTQGRDRGSGTGEQERGEDVLGSGRHYACSPFAKRSMPSVRPYFSTSFDRRTRSLGRVENLA